MAKRVNGWLDAVGVLHETEVQADMADARRSLEATIDYLIESHDYHFDLDGLIAHRAEVIELLRVFDRSFM